MADAVRGLHETLVTEALARQLDALKEAYHVRTQPLRPADTADRIARHLAALVERALSDVPEDSRASVGVALVRALSEQIERRSAASRDLIDPLSEPP